MLRTNFRDGSKIPSEWLELRYQVFALPGRNPAILKLGQSNFTLWGVRADVYQPILASLAKIAQKVLIIWGEEDGIIPVKHAYIAAAGIPNSQLRIFPDCGHHPYLEYPDQFNQMVLDFLLDSTTSSS